MKKVPSMLFALIFAALLLSSFPTFARQAPAASSESKVEPNPISAQVRHDLDESAKNFVAAAQEMPAEKYSFQPTPQQISFAHLIIHATRANYFFCSKLSGAAAPDVKVSDTDPKDKLVPALQASYDFCTTNLANLQDTNLGQTMPFFGGRTITRGGMMVTMSADFADHYSMAAMYLRLNGLLPPTAKK